MRFALVLVALSAAAAQAEVVAKEAAVDTTRDLLVRDIEDGDKLAALQQEVDEVIKMPDVDKTWGQSINLLTPTAETFAAHLPEYVQSPIKPEIAQAFNLDEEVANWNKEGNPNHLTFVGDLGQPTYAVMSANQPVFSSSYGKDVRFHLFTKHNESDMTGYQVQDFKVLQTEGGFDPALPVKVIVHGFTNTIRSSVNQLLKNAFLETGKYNVICVDWGDLCRGPWYHSARVHVTGAGAKIGEFLDALISLKLTEPSKIHIIGHSLGAHTAGIAAKSMKLGRPARITGLDPAGPLFQLTKKAGILWKDDADLVDVIHTNAGFLGKSAHLGHVDFFPNGGHFQPGCHADVTGACSHGRSYEIFASTIRNKDVELVADLCPTLPSGAGKCETNIRQHRNKGPVARMGYDVKFDREGSYFIKTSDKANFLFNWK